MSAERVAIYTARRAEAQAALATLDRKSAWVANFRLIAFLAMAAALVLTWMHRMPGWGYALAGGALLGFIALVAVHARLSRAESRQRERVRLNERGLARLSGEWHAFPSRGEKHADARHPSAVELDIVEPGSLFQLLDETATTAGEAALAQALLAPPPLDVSRARQGAISELASELDFRQALVVEARTGGHAKADPNPFVRWAETPPTLTRLRWVIPLPFLLPPLTLALYVLLDRDVLAAPFYLIPLLAQMAVVAVTRRAFAELFNGLSMGESGLLRLEEVFAHIERQPFRDPLLRERVRGLAEGALPVSARLRALGRVYGFSELRRNQLHPLVNVLTLLDALTFFRLDDWRAREGQQVRSWFAALAELESLCALATYAYEHPGAVYPELTAERTCLVAKGLAHPLLRAPVRNDVELPESGSALLITGSNMSGKTTLLRALGANVALARAGAPVMAEEMTLSELDPLTSMRVKDSLERGVSYFYAEVQRLKAVLDAATARPGKALFLLDEILLGTNTRERQVASHEVIQLLLQTGAIGGVSTHDLTLTALEAETQGKVRNVHFRDQLEGETMTFDYRLREGVVQTTNALRVLRLAGVPLRSS